MKPILCITLDTSRSDEALARLPPIQPTPLMETHRRMLEAVALAHRIPRRLLEWRDTSR